MASLLGLEQQPNSPPVIPAAPAIHATAEIKVGKRLASLNGKDIEVFTMTLGGETIELLPLRNWGQLDIFKWRVRGKLPGTPAGLEISSDHIKLLGQTVFPTAADACQKLEQLFDEWLAVERQGLELAKKKLQPKAALAQEAGAHADAQSMRFRVELDRENQVHIQCIQGKETLATIGLNPTGFQSLINQGFMRKPHALKTGALHNWVELDGTLYSFEKGNNDAAKLEQALNETYLPPSTFGRDKEIVVFANSASSTGFDIQFPAKAAGTTENRRRPLAEDSLEILQDPEHCGLLQKGLVIKLSRPTLIFKQRTPEGGERYLEKCRENLLKISVDEAEEKVIDLSQPVNYLHLSAMELTAVFNHPSINKHAVTKQSAPAANEKKAASPQSTSAVPVSGPSELSATAQLPGKRPAAVKQPLLQQPASSQIPAEGQKTSEPRLELPKRAAVPLPNAWIRRLLEQPPIRFDWFTCLVYEKIASWARNSQQGTFDERSCWYIDLVPDDQVDSAGFKRVFLTDKGTFGFWSGTDRVSFESGALTVNEGLSVVKAENVRLLGVGLDSANRVVFLIDGRLPGAPAAAMETLKARGVALMAVKEALESEVPIEMLWTAPVEQSTTADHKAIESTRPTETSAERFAGAGVQPTPPSDSHPRQSSSTTRTSI